MKIAIIEDEFITAEELEHDILEVEPTAEIVTRIDTVEGAVAFFSEHPAVDLVFSDIQLADGLSFEIFEVVKPSSPIIFCTAFDEYAIQAFQANGIDYILKPFDRRSIAASLAKFSKLKSHFQSAFAPQDAPYAEQLGKLIAQITPNSKRSSFLVSHRGRFFPVLTQDIAFFFTEHDNVWLVRMNGDRYTVNHSLDELEKLLDPSVFYRANRQFIVNFESIKEFEPYFNRKLAVKLKLSTPEPLLISKEKASHFVRWMQR